MKVKVAVVVQENKDKLHLKIQIDKLKLSVCIFR